MRWSRCMSLLPRTTLHSDSEQWWLQLWLSSLLHVAVVTTIMAVAAVVPTKWLWLQLWLLQWIRLLLWWLYSSSNSFSCDGCISYGCSCAFMKVVIVLVAVVMMLVAMVAVGMVLMLIVASVYLRRMWRMNTSGFGWTCDGCTGHVQLWWFLVHRYGYRCDCCISYR